MTKDEAQHSRWTFYEAVNPFRPLQPIQSPGLMVKLKQLSAFSATLGFWNVAYHCEKGYYAEGMITQTTLLS